MGTEELKEEIDAIEAIFPESVEQITSEIYNFTVPDHAEVTVQMSFPTEYPEEPPSIIQVITGDIRKFPDNSYIEQRVNSILSNLFNTGDVVIFEFLGEVEQFIEDYERQHEEETKKLSEQMEKLRLEQAKRKQMKLQDIKRASDGAELASVPSVDVTADWIQSEPIHDRGSTFIAYAKEVHSVAEAIENFELLFTDRKIARASHNMNAWRIKGEKNITFLDCDDDGETAAGLRMLHLLTVCYIFSFTMSRTTNTADHECMERYRRCKQMVRRNPYWARPLQTYKLHHT